MGADIMSRQGLKPGEWKQNRMGNSSEWKCTCRPLKRRPTVSSSFSSHLQLCWGWMPWPRLCLYAFPPPIPLLFKSEFPRMEFNARGSVQGGPGVVLGLNISPGKLSLVDSDQVRHFFHSQLVIWKLWVWTLESQIPVFQLTLLRPF